MITRLIYLAEKGILPNFLIRMGIRKLCKVRLDSAKRSTPGDIEKHHQKWIDILKKSPIALVPEMANEQHYEVPASFFKQVLGPKLKYSSGHWPNGTTTLEKSEVSMLELSCERAELND